MNTDKTLKESFISNSDKYPIWYYKELIEIDVDEVIFNLLKETFVVEVNSKKIVITFGKNRKHEIGSTQSCDEGLDYTSFETVTKAFREGKWFRISSTDTTDEFKSSYLLGKQEKEKLSMRKLRIKLLTNALNCIKDTSKYNNIEHRIESLSEMTDEELEFLANRLFK